MRYINHCISKRIVEIAKAEGKALPWRTCWVFVNGPKLQEVQPHDVGLELSGAGFIHRIQGRPCRGARNLRRSQGDFQDLSAVRECFPLQPQDSGLV